MITAMHTDEEVIRAATESVRFHFAMGEQLAAVIAADVVRAVRPLIEEQAVYDYISTKETPKIEITHVAGTPIASFIQEIQVDAYRQGYKDREREMDYDPGSVL